MFTDLANFVSVFSIPQFLIPALLAVFFWVAAGHPHRVRRPGLFRLAFGMVAISLVLFPAILIAGMSLGLGPALAPPEPGYGRGTDPTLAVGRLYLAAGGGAYFSVAVLLAVSSIEWRGGGPAGSRAPGG